MNPCHRFQNAWRGGRAELVKLLIRTKIMKYGARNQMTGKVVAIKKGKLMCQVTLEIPAKCTVSSVMTLDSLAELGIKKGSPAKAIIKAINVLLAAD